MKVLGLTGSIGMGKSTTAQMFRDAGIPVYDADAAVHELYRGEAAREIELAFPGTVTDGTVDRTELSKRVVGREVEMKRLESIIHPLVHAKQAAFLKLHMKRNEPLVILDIPLLFEGGREGQVDAVVVVTCSPEEQRRRVLDRPGMTEDKFNSILARQVPDAQKRAKADYIVDTGSGLEDARQQVLDIVRSVLDDDSQIG